MGVKLKALAVFGLFLYVGGVTVAAAEQVQGTTEATSNQHGCPQASAPLPISFRACCVQESKVLPLLAQISAVLKLFNSEEGSIFKPEIQLRPLSKLVELKKCSIKEIQLLVTELGWITRQVWKLSNRLQEPQDAQFQMITKRQIDLVRHLRNLTVYTGDWSASSMQLMSFNAQVNLLDAGFKEALAALDTQRPLRNNVESILASINSQSSFLAKEERTRSTILDPRRTVAELIELSKTNPEDMSEALPQLISNRYAGKLENAKLVIDFIQQLPNVVHQMIGYASLYDAMSASSDLESYELTELVLHFRGINASVTSAGADIPRSVLTRYTQLVEDVWPVYQVVGRNTTCDFKNLNYKRAIDGITSMSILGARESQIYWGVYPIPGTAKFAINYRNYHQIYSSRSETFSSSKRNVKYRDPTVPELFAQWKLVPVEGGKYFKILNAMHDEVLFADKTEMVSGSTDRRRLFLTRHDYLGAYDYEQNADLWEVKCT